MNEETEIIPQSELDKVHDEELTQLAAAALQGLLASGHFTYIFLGNPRLDNEVDVCEIAVSLASKTHDKLKYRYQV